MNRIPDLSVREYMELGDIPVLSYILQDAKLAACDLKGESVFYMDEESNIVKGARQALEQIGILSLQNQ